jgi:uncharacterized protein (TIRG00374 family)
LYYVLARTGAGAAIRPLLGSSWLLPALFLLTLGGAAIEAARLVVLFRAAELKLSFGGAYRVVMIGTFFNFCIPGGTGGDVVKLYYLAAGNRRKGIEVATVLLVDRAVALGALMLLVLGLSAINAERVAANGVLIGLVGTAAVAFCSVLLVAGCVSSRRLRQSRLYERVMRMVPLRAYVERAAEAAHAFGGRKRTVLAAASLSFVGHMGTGLMFVLIGSVVLPAIPALITALLALMGMVANALPITPGGLGVGEAAFDQLFGVLGVTGAAALLIVWRLGLVPFATLGALAYMAGAGRSVSAPGSTPTIGPLAGRQVDS